MQIIYCNINLFDYEQSIYMSDLEKQTTELIARTPKEELGKVIPKLCYNKQVYEVRLKCVVPGLANQAADLISEQAIKTYGVFNKINVEVW